jgi:hypothetical protein
LREALKDPRDFPNCCQPLAEVALMLERLGYDVITDPGSSEFVVAREGCKSIVACARPSDVEPVKTHDLAVCTQPSSMPMPRPVFI